MSDTKSPFISPPDAALDRALDTLRRESEALNTPRHIEVLLMAAFATAAESTGPLQSENSRMHSRRDGFSRLFGQWFAPGMAIGASVVMASWMMLSPLSQAIEDVGTDSVAALAYASDTGNPFIALESLERIAEEPTPRLIAANVPRTSLAAYGVAINPEIAGQSVRTEMLVAANGQPLAMRFVP